VAFYFKERQPGTGAMMGIVLEQANSARADKAGASVAGNAIGQPATGTEDAESTKGTSLASTSETLALQDRRMGQPEKLTELTLIFAQSGKFDIRRLGAEDDPSAESEITLTLDNGSIHNLSADPAKPDYSVIGFERLDKRRLYAAEIEKPHHAFDTGTLRRKIDEQMRLPPDKRDKIVGSLYKELWQRLSMWLATFVFALVGIPLAIWVRPSGKSWGIMIAIGLMLIYYVILQIGLSMVQVFAPGGAIVTLAPNALYALIGAVLWRQTLRS
jgi:lipopolysaccharide export LptBFGC system permease protein LptF